MTRRFKLARERDAALRGREVDAELRFHLEERVEELVATGMARHEAERVVRERFGDINTVRAECEAIDATMDRRRSRGERLGAVMQHGRLAMRSLVRRPSFAIVSVVTLALGCAAVTAAFTLVDRILLRPLPYPAPNDLVAVSHSAVLSGKTTAMDQSDAIFLLYEGENSVFENIGAYRERSLNVALPSTGRQESEAERVLAATVSSSLFPTLRVAPQLGRAFAKGEDRVGAAPVVVISDALWRRKLGGDARAIGQQLLVHGVSREIVGIMPPGFDYPGHATQLWLPASFDPTNASPASFDFNSIARLKPGMTIEGAMRDLNRIVVRTAEAFPGEVPPAMWAQAQVRSVVRPLRDVLVGDVKQLLWILLGSAGLVLVVACANVAGLFVVRAEEGQHELAVRRALGAGTAAALAQYLAEAVLVALGGTVLGVALAATALRSLRLFPGALDLPRLADVAIDGRVLAFVVLVLALCAAALSILPLLRARGISVASVLKTAGRGAMGSVRTQRARNVLVVAQVAMAMVLVSASGLMARSFLRLRDVAPGFEGDHVLSMRVALPPATYPDAESRARFQARLLERLTTIPGARRSAITTWIPLSGDQENGAVLVEGLPQSPDEVPPVHSRVYVSDSAFRVMGTAMVEGRTFTALDPTRPSEEVIVSQAFARRYWPGQSAVGKRIRQGVNGVWTTVVGVVGDVHLLSLQQPAEEAVYLPLYSRDPGVRGSPTSAPSVLAVVVRADGDPSALVRPVRDAIHSIDRALPTYDERPLADVVRSAAARMRFTFLLLGAASFVTLLLGAVGIYGVLAYGVSLRRREFGVRMALGARPSDVRRIVARQGVRLAAIGVGLGLVVALGTMRLLGSLLYGVSPTDPMTLGVTCLVLVVVAFVASWLPARQAAAMAPTVAIRGD